MALAQSFNPSVVPSTPLSTVEQFPEKQVLTVPSGHAVISITDIEQTLHPGAAQELNNTIPEKRAATDNNTFFMLINFKIFANILLFIYTTNPTTMIIPIDSKKYAHYKYIINN
ncbi:MAG: hypothetical protein IAE67_08600 [Candidatus Competibacteraceae bacterium]|nr:hypothetical protein [Candidatus Competibacteraceae bacterium]